MDQDIFATLLAYVGAKDQSSQTRDTLLAVLNELPFSINTLSYRGQEQNLANRDLQVIRTALSSTDETISPGLVGRLARNAFEFSNFKRHRKQYGQFFTPPSISALACAAAIRSAKVSIIDPMCGTGAMLWAAQDRLAYLGVNNSATLTGVELDPLAAKIATLPPDEHYTQDAQRMSVLCSDAFLELSGLLSDTDSNHYGSYDAIIGNPPYVRYQQIASMYHATYPEIVERFQKELPKEPKSVITDTIIRTSLITHLIPGKDRNLRDIAPLAVSMLRSQTLPQVLNPVDACWLKIVSQYSGLSDLSLPAWLQTWLLARSGAIIAYVTTASWKNREYSRFLRYFMLRMLQPLYFIEQEGSWFNDALIPTSLMIFRARSPEEIAIPLREREKSTHTVKLVRIQRDFNLAKPLNLEKAAFYLSSRRVDEFRPKTSAYADMVIEAIERQEQDLTSNLWTINSVPEQTLIDALFNEDAAVRRSAANGIGLPDLEYPQTHFNLVHSVNKATTTHPTTIPYFLQQALGIASVSSDAFRLFTDYDIDVNQGLRTGCNPFFYVRRLMDSDWANNFPNESPVDVNATLENPQEHSSHFLAIMERLRKMDAFVAEEPPSICPPSSLIKLDKEFGEKLGVFPISALKPVVRYQRHLEHWSVRNPELLPDCALVLNAGATPEDYVNLSSYSDYWVTVWKERFGLSELPSGLAKYISVAAKTTLERNGNVVPIPKLSAVAPNVRLPAHPVRFSLFTDEVSVPALPTWWYTLPVLQRHIGAVFMARVNHESPCAYLNSTPSPALIDANFSTLSSKKLQISAEAVFALLNSIWVRALLEAIATPMGGGALKVEAAHLRILPLPCLDRASIMRLDELGKVLARLPKSHRDVFRILQEIDATVVRQVATMLHLDVSHILTVLNAFTSQLQMRRKK